MTVTIYTAGEQILHVPGGPLTERAPIGVSPRYVERCPICRAPGMKTGEREWRCSRSGCRTQWA